MLGLHWVCDLAGCAPDRLTASAVHEALTEVPRLLGLEVVGVPRLSEHEDGGASSSIAGVVLLRESHASCHCFPATAAVHLDVFSCKAVDFDLAVQFVTRHFGAAQANERVIERGAEQRLGSLGRVVRNVR